MCLYRKWAISEVPEVKAAAQLVSATSFGLPAPAPTPAPTAPTAAQPAAPSQPTPIVVKPGIVSPIKPSRSVAVSTVTTNAADTQQPASPKPAKLTQTPTAPVAPTP